MLPALAGGLAALDEVLGGDASIAWRTTSAQKGLVAAIWADPDGAGAVGAKALGLLTRSLENLYACWLERDDPARWWDEHGESVAGLDRPWRGAACDLARAHSGGAREAPAAG